MLGAAALSRFTQDTDSTAVTHFTVELMRAGGSCNRDLTLNKLRINVRIYTF